MGEPIAEKGGIWANGAVVALMLKYISQRKKKIYILSESLWGIWGKGDFQKGVESSILERGGSNACGKR